MHVELMKILACFSHDPLKVQNNVFWFSRSAILDLSYSDPDLNDLISNDRVSLKFFQYYTVVVIWALFSSDWLTVIILPVFSNHGPYYKF